MHLKFFFRFCPETSQAKIAYFVYGANASSYTRNARLRSARKSSSRTNKFSLSTLSLTLLHLPPVALLRQDGDPFVLKHSFSSLLNTIRAITVSFQEAMFSGILSTGISAFLRGLIKRSNLQSCPTWYQRRRPARTLTGRVAPHSSCRPRGRRPEEYVSRQTTHWEGELCI